MALDFTITTPTTAIGAGTPTRAITLTLSGTGTLGSDASFALSDGSAGGAFYPASPAVIVSGQTVGATTQFVYVAPLAATGTIVLTVVATGGMTATHTLSLPVGTPSIFCRDAFFGTAATPVFGSTPDVGAVWGQQALVGSTGVVLSGSNSAYQATGSQSESLYLPTSATTGEYDVSCDVAIPSPFVDAPGIMICAPSGTANPASGYTLSPYILGAFVQNYPASTVIAGPLGTFTPGTTYHIRLAVRTVNAAQTIFALINGAMVGGTGYPDSTHTGGYPGIWNQSVGASSSESTASHYQNFLGSNADWSTTQGVVLDLDAISSTTAVNADGTGGTPSDGASFHYIGDRSGFGVNATTTGVTASRLPTYRAGGIGGHPAWDFSLIGGQVAALSLGLPSILNAAEGGNSYTISIAGTWKPYPGGTQYDNQIALSRNSRWCNGTVKNSAGPFASSPGPDFGRYNSRGLWSERGVLPTPDGVFFTMHAVYDNVTSSCVTGSGIERVYVNGMPKKAQNSPATADPTTPVAFGAMDLAGDFAWEGLLCKARILNRVMTPAEVLTDSLSTFSRWSQTHPLSTAPYVIVSDGNSFLGSMQIGYLVETVTASLGMSPDHVFNLAWGGKTTTQMRQCAAVDVDPLLALIRATIPGGSPILFWFYEGSNENSLGGTLIASHLEAYGTERLAFGWPFTVGTSPLPYGNTTQCPDASAILRSDFAASVPWCTQFADTQSNLQMGNPANTSNTALFQDTVHPTYPLGDSKLSPYIVAQLEAGGATTASKFPALLLFQTPGGC